MQANDHVALARKLVQCYMPYHSKLRKEAFILGNVAPDLAVTTYLHGRNHGSNTWGHSYINTQRLISKMDKKLRRVTRGSIFHYFMLGLLLHYTADAFTWPHNHEFGNSMHAHILYEDILHIQIEQKLVQPVSVIEMEEFNIDRVHRSYLKQRDGVSTDCDYIFQSTECLTGYYCHRWANNKAKG